MKMTVTRQRTASHCATLTVAALFLVFCCALRPSASAQTLWQNPGNGDWFTSSNWSAGTPTGAVDAQINNGGTGQIVTPGSASAMNLSLGRNSGESGTLEISNGSLSNSAATIVGRVGTGTLNISGGTLSNTTGDVGQLAGSTGVVNVSGGKWTSSGILRVGYSGSGTLNISGSGEVISNGARRYDSQGHIGSDYGSTGVVNVSGGKLSVGSTFYIGRNGDGTLRISGTGEVFSQDVYIGDGSTSTGAVSVSGGNWENTGRIRVGRNGTGTLDISGGIVTSRNIMLGAFGTLSLRGTSAKRGVLATSLIDGDGGATFIFDGGILRVTTGETPLFVGFGPGDVIFAAGGAFIDTNGFDAVTGQPITGPGGLTKQGAGTLRLTGANVYTGATTIDAGTLQVDGSIASALTTVNTTGTLAGTGVIGGSVVNYGIVSPGNSPGTLTISGDYTQSAIGTLQIEIASASSYDQLKIGGAANLNGTLQIITLGGFVPKTTDKFTILIANGRVNGKFSTIDQSLSLVKYEVAYEPNEVVLSYLGTQFVPFFEQLANKLNLLTSLRLTPNQKSVAGALDRSSRDPRQFDLIDYLLVQDIVDLPADFDRIAPEELSAMFEMTLETTEMQQQSIINRLRNARAGATSFTGSLALFDARGSLNLNGLPLWAGTGDGQDMLATLGYKSEKDIFQPDPQNKWGVWATGSGEFIDVDSDWNAPGYSFRTGGVTVGIDCRVADPVVIGLAGSYARSDTDLTEDGSADTDGAHLALYSTWQQTTEPDVNGAYVNGIIGASYNSYDTRRHSIGGFANGDTNGYALDALIGGGYDIHSGKVTFGPTASLGYTYVGIDGYRERGSMAPLEIDDQSADSLRSRLGARVDTALEIGSVILHPELRVEWQHEFLNDNYAIGSSFANGASGAFTVEGPSLGSDSLILGAGVDMQWSNRFSSYVSYEGELGRDNYQRHTVNGGIRWEF